MDYDRFIVKVFKPTPMHAVCSMPTSISVHSRSLCVCNLKLLCVWSYISLPPPLAFASSYYCLPAYTQNNIAAGFNEVANAAMPQRLARSPAMSYDIFRLGRAMKDHSGRRGGDEGGGGLGGSLASSSGGRGSGFAGSSPPKSPESRKTSLQAQKFQKSLSPHERKMFAWLRFTGEDTKKTRTKN